MTRTEMIARLLEPSRKTLAKTVAESFRTAAQSRLDTNRAFLEGLDDEGLAARFAVLDAPPNSRCACDGSLCSCRPLKHGDSVARLDGDDPAETPREKMARANRELATTSTGSRLPDVPAPLPERVDTAKSPREQMIERQRNEALKPLGREEIMYQTGSAHRVRVYDDADREWQPPTTDPKTTPRERMLAELRTRGSK